MLSIQPLTDSDGDGFPDIYDGCHSEKGSLENDGCGTPPTFWEKYGWIIVIIVIVIAIIIAIIKKLNG